MKRIVMLLLVITLSFSVFTACAILKADEESIGETIDDTVYTKATENLIYENNISSTEPSNTEYSEPCSQSDEILNYDDVIEMYKNIVNLYPDYTEEKLNSGVYDGIDSVVNEESKEVYKALFVSGYRFYFEDYAMRYLDDGKKYFGYAFTDINKNGSEELILLNDLYDIIAIFGIEENRPKLLIDNYERNCFCRIDAQGRIYTEKNDSSVLYTQIYLLNNNDALELIEEYQCVKYNYRNHDECYKLMGGEKIRIPKSEWMKATHGWMNGNKTGLITKTYADLKFIRLFGELKLYQPPIVSWDWKSSQFFNLENVLIISNISDDAVTFSLYDQYEIYHRKAVVQAELNGNIAEFNTDEIKGRIEFGLDSIWMIVEESDIEGLPCGAFLYDKMEILVG